VKVNCSKSLLKVEFTVAGSGSATLNLYSLSGSIVKTNVIQTRAGGVYSRSYDLSDIPAGFYILKVAKDGDIILRSKVLVTR
jgi:hypothetical protein